MSQENTRPGYPPANYSAWRSHLTHRTADLRHDALTHTGLGHHTARVYQALTTTPTDVVDLISRTGYTRSRVSRLLDRLATHHLARTDRRGRWQLRGRTHTSGTRLGRAARTLDVLGLLADRARRYTIERAAWAWWTDELAWRRAPAAVKQRAPGAGQLELVPTAGGRVRDHHGRHPSTTAAAPTTPPPSRTWPRPAAAADRPADAGPADHRASRPGFGSGVPSGGWSGHLGVSVRARKPTDAGPRPVKGRVNGPPIRLGRPTPEGPRGRHHRTSDPPPARSP